MFSSEFERDPELDAVLDECSVSIKSHLQLFHSDRFDRPFSSAHEELFEVVDDPSVQKVLVIAHRGFGKTSIFNYGIPSQHIIFEKTSFIVPVSATATQAVMQADNLKQELLYSDTIKSVVGSIKSEAFSRDMWKTAARPNTPKGIMVLPRGQGQQVRGILHGNDRPGLIIVDDLEDSESVMNPELRTKLKQWFFSDLSNSIDRAKNNYRILVIGTILHESALLQDLREDSSWVTLEYPLCDDEFKSTWVNFMTDDNVEKLVQDHRNQGIVEEFYREYMNICNPKEDAVFKAEMFKYYDEEEENLDGRADIIHAVLVDPAKTSKVHNDFTAIVGCALDQKQRRIYVRDIVNRHLQPDEIYDEVFQMAERLDADVIGWEETGLNEFITQPVVNEMLKRTGGGGKIRSIEWLKARTGKGQYYGKDKGKEGRIATLAPHYRLGLIYHNPLVCGVLETQLLSFPRAKHDDVMDCLAYVIQIMERGDFYFDEERPDEWEEEQEQRDEEQEFEALEVEDEQEVSVAGYGIL